MFFPPILAVGWHREGCFAGVYEERSVGVFLNPVIHSLSFTSVMLKVYEWVIAFGSEDSFHIHPISPITVFV